MPAALDRSYDGIIVGAGHHGLVLGSYLAKCGLDILLVDRRLQYGGALVTEEVTAPGFQHNLHSINHFHISETPWFKDLHLEDRVSYITPRYEFGQPHLDGTALDFRPRPRGDAGQRRAILQEGRADLPRLEQEGRGDHRQDFPARAVLRAAAAGRARGAAGEERHRPRFPRGDEAPAVRHGEGAVRERARAAPVPVQDFAVRHVARRHHVENEPDGLGDPRLRSAERLPALQGRLRQSRPRAVRDIHRRGRPLRAAGRARQDRHRGRQGDRHRAEGRTHRASEAVRRLDAQRAPDLRGLHRPGAASRGVPQEARRLPVHHLDAVRPASGDARAGALHRREIRSASASHPEMVARRRNDGRVARRA